MLNNPMLFWAILNYPKDKILPIPLGVSSIVYPQTPRGVVAHGYATAHCF